MPQVDASKHLSESVLRKGFMDGSREVYDTHRGLIPLFCPDNGVRPLPVRYNPTDHETGLVMENLHTQASPGKAVTTTSMNKVERNFNTEFPNVLHRVSDFLRSEPVTIACGYVGGQPQDFRLLEANCREEAWNQIHSAPRAPDGVPARLFDALDKEKRSRKYLNSEMKKFDLDNIYYGHAYYEDAYLCMKDFSSIQPINFTIPHCIDSKSSCSCYSYHPLAILKCVEDARCKHKPLSVLNSPPHQAKKKEEWWWRLVSLISALAAAFCQHIIYKTDLQIDPPLIKCTE